MIKNRILIACALIARSLHPASATSSFFNFDSPQASCSHSAFSTSSASAAPLATLSVSDLPDMSAANKDTVRMPAVFIGHGSPMLAIQDSPYAPKWRKFFSKFPKPKAILCISAHWYGRGTAVTFNDKPPTIHDFGGFPQELFDVQYPSPGDKHLCNRVKELLEQGPAARKVQLDESWGLDHGAWTILKHIWPEADIPVVQLRIDSSLKPAEHIEVGRQLSALRDEGYLILGSGNVVHNLREIEWGAEGRGSDLCKKFDTDVNKWVSSRDFDAIGKWESHPNAKRAHSSVDHFLPIAYIAGASAADDKFVTISEGYDMGSLSMRSFAYVAPEKTKENSESAPVTEASAAEAAAGEVEKLRV